MCITECGAGGRWRITTEDGCWSCRRAMDDKEFERTVEELYAPGKAPSAPTVALQPAARPSMDARGTVKPPSPAPAPTPHADETDEERRELER